MLAGPSADDEHVSTAVRLFVENTTRADDATIADWTQALLASESVVDEERSHGSSEGTRTGTRSRSTSSRSASTSRPSPRTRPSGASRTRSRPRAWSASGPSVPGAGATAELATVTAEHEAPDPLGVEQVRVDAGDRAEAVLGDAADGASATVAAVQATFDELGWPGPTVGLDDVIVTSAC